MIDAIALNACSWPFTWVVQLLRSWVSKTPPSWMLTTRLSLEVSATIAAAICASTPRVLVIAALVKP